MPKLKHTTPMRFFSFIEMMVVLLIISIMSATIAYNMQGGIKEAERIRKLQAAKLIESTLTYELQIDSSEVKQGIHLQDWGQAIEKSSLLDQEKKNYYKQLVSNQEIDLNYAEGVVKAQVK